MKALVLCLDGLEYNLVTEGGYRNLLQVEHGKVRVPILDAGEPSTPIVWVSFITGEQPAVHGVDFSSKVNSPLVDKLASFTSNFLGNRLYRRLLTAGTPVRRWLKTHKSFRSTMPTKEDILVPTIFDVVSSSVHVSLPILDYDISERYNGVLGAIINPAERVQYTNFLLNDFREDKLALLKVWGKYELIMCHFHIPDLWGHIYCRDDEKMYQLYGLLDAYVKFLSDKLGAVFLLIISDHGIDKNFGHSNYGYYSCNRKLGLDCPDITDFYAIILEALNEAL